jgi:hypothetical protein
MSLGLVYILLNASNKIIKQEPLTFCLVAHQHVADQFSLMIEGEKYSGLKINGLILRNYSNK